MERPWHGRVPPESRSRLAAAGIAAVLLAGIPSVARSQCVKDTDCKGDRICSDGVCVDAVAREPVRNWALSAGAGAVVSGGITLGLSIAADVNSEPAIKSSLFGGLVLTTIIQSPVTAAGGRSARVATGVEGERGARVGGWIFFGVGLATGAGNTLYGIANKAPPPPGWILGSGLACVLSQALLAVDAFVSHTQALARASAAVDRDRRAGIAVLPSLAPYLGADGGNGAVLGLTGSF